MKAPRGFAEFASRVARAAGRPLTFAVSIAVILVWAVCGPVFGFSDTWQLVINTSTTIVTFLMVFLIQNTQNRDGAAIQAKLDELIRASAAHNRYIGIEGLTGEELDHLRAHCASRAARDMPEELLDAAERAEDEANEKAQAAAARVAGAATYPS
ncbi:MULTISPECIES: low affinity iron permease family protein [unclassified Methylobacterium]|uniref:low affinity iron permease family protein n=1 Tax=unclassified Methylobacterium TaxID=2615210 RepID=UPI002269C830|nr:MULTISPECIES: low affinity iron permease family protein [unclassified Methylobacterium]